MSSNLGFPALLTNFKMKWKKMLYDTLTVPPSHLLERYLRRLALTLPDFFSQRDLSPPPRLVSGAQPDLGWTDWVSTRNVSTRNWVR